MRFYLLALALAGCAARGAPPRALAARGGSSVAADAAAPAAPAAPATPAGDVLTSVPAWCINLERNPER